MWVHLMLSLSQCSDLTLPVPSIGCGCALCAWFISLSWLDPLCTLDSWWVSLASLVYYSVLTWPFLCFWQDVSAPHMLALFQCPNLAISVPLTGCECPSHACFVSVFWLVPPYALDRWWVPLTCSVCFSVLTWPSLYPQQFVSAPCMLGLF